LKKPHNSSKASRTSLTRQLWMMLSKQSSSKFNNRNHYHSQLCLNSTSVWKMNHKLKQLNQIKDHSYKSWLTMPRNKKNNRNN
jgi:hypothetical protein